jgi:hypothetical protein
MMFDSLSPRYLATLAGLRGVTTEELRQMLFNTPRRARARRGGSGLISKLVIGEAEGGERPRKRAAEAVVEAVPPTNAELDDRFRRAQLRLMKHGLQFPRE